MTLGADEFMRRFLLHVLPGGFHRIRHYGLLANAGRREHLARARELLHVVPAAAEAPATAGPASPSSAPTFVCPHCGAAMSIVETFARGQPIRAPPPLRSGSMITGIGRFNAASALRRLPPIADGFALRCRNVVSHPLRHPRIQPRTVTIQHPRDVALRSHGPIAASGRTANRRIPIAV